MGSGQWYDQVDCFLNHRITHQQDRWKIDKSTFAIPWAARWLQAFMQIGTTQADSSVIGVPARMQIPIAFPEAMKHDVSKDNLRGPYSVIIFSVGSSAYC